MLPAHETQEKMGRASKHNQSKPVDDYVGDKEISEDDEIKNRQRRAV